MRDSDLDDLFAQVRQPVAVPADLMARVLADADAAQPVSAPRLPQTGLLAGFWAAIGGFGGVAGLSSAAVAGAWIGFAQPMALTTLTDSLLTGDVVAETVNILPGFDDFLDEG